MPEGWDIVSHQLQNLLWLISYFFAVHCITAILARYTNGVKLPLLWNTIVMCNAYFLVAQDRHPAITVTCHHLKGLGSRASAAYDRGVRRLDWFWICLELAEVHMHPLEFWLFF